MSEEPDTMQDIRISMLTDRAKELAAESDTWNKRAYTFFAERMQGNGLLSAEDYAEYRRMLRNSDALFDESTKLLDRAWELMKESGEPAQEEKSVDATRHTVVLTEHQYANDLATAQRTALRIAADTVRELRDETLGDEGRLLLDVAVSRLEHKRDMLAPEPSR